MTEMGNTLLLLSTFWDTLSFIGNSGSQYACEMHSWLGLLCHVPVSNDCDVTCKSDPYFLRKRTQTYIYL
jgi:hypothetical protein